MKIQCTEAEKNQLLDIIEYHAPCKLCPLDGTQLCNKHVYCRINLERGLSFDITDATYDERIENQMIKIVKAYNWLKEQDYRSGLQSYSLLKDSLCDKWDSLNCGLSSAYIDKVAEYVKSHTYLKAKELWRVVQRMVRGEECE